MSNKMWFGNRTFMRWIDCPQVGDNLLRLGRSTSMNFLNGGAARTLSKSAAKSYSFTWSRTSRDEIRAITDFSDGVYGDGPFYWADPFTMDKNVLPQAFATPSIAGYDGTILDGTNRRPDLVPTSANGFLQPAESAVYSMNGASPQRVWIPIPPGYDLLVGASGIAGSGGGVYVQPTQGKLPTGSAVALSLLSPTGATRLNYRLASSATVNGAEIYLGGTGTMTLTSMMAQLVPSGTPAYAGDYISGQGHSGCEFEEHPTVEQYSAVFDLVGASASLTEVGQWL